VLGEAEEDVGQAVAGVELVVVHLPGEDDLVDAQLAHELPQPVEVALEAPVVPHHEESAAGLDPPLEEGEAADEVLDPLVRDHPAHEEHVRPAVVVQAAHHRRRRPVVEREVEDDGQDAGPPEAGLLELASVELAVPERQLRAGAKAASSRRPWWHSPARCGWKPRKKEAG
jgi:hypothetical protein